MNAENTYYKLPFNPRNLFQDNSRVEVCGLAESIAQNLMLLIVTKKEENRFDSNYGNAVWDFEFDNDITEPEWEDIFKKSMLTAIALHEPRITHPLIHTQIVYTEKISELKNYIEIKKKAIIHIRAKLADSGENYNFSTEVFLGPMFID